MLALNENHLLTSPCAMFVARRKNSPTYEEYDVEYRDIDGDMRYVTTKPVDGKRITWELGGSVWEYPVAMSGDALGDGVPAFKWETVFSATQATYEHDKSVACALNDIMKHLEGIDFTATDISALCRIAARAPHELSKEQLNHIINRAQTSEVCNLGSEKATAALTGIIGSLQHLMMNQVSKAYHSKQPREQRNFLKLTNPTNNNLLIGFHKGERVRLALAGAPIADVDVVVDSAAGASGINVKLPNGKEGVIMVDGGKLSFGAYYPLLGGNQCVHTINKLEVLPKICAEPGRTLGFTVVVIGNPKDEYMTDVYHFDEYPRIDDGGYIVCGGESEVRYHMSEVAIWRQEERDRCDCAPTHFQVMPDDPQYETYKPFPYL